MKKTVKKVLPTPADLRIAKYYDEQTDDEIAAEIDKAMEDPDAVLVPIPRPLLDKVLSLIQKKKLA